ncbi:hypothetical protein J6590_070014 [Homalodisca vitripennis]|nr:hypothetical protein J6590_070014 [Homalodisca vitripennis]
MSTSHSAVWLFACFIEQVQAMSGTFTEILRGTIGARSLATQLRYLHILRYVPIVAKEEHNDKDCTSDEEYFMNCKENHPSSSKNSKAYLEEKEILKITTDEKV